VGDDRGAAHTLTAGDAHVDRAFLERALALAERGWGRVHPNPLVGAVVVRGDVIVGEGWHAEYGAPHAEVIALAQAAEAGRDATLYVTLEPCAHHGRTPPCTDAIRAAGIRRVVYGAADPNPKAAGGARVLREAGVVVEGGIAEQAVREQNRSFFHLHEATAPFVALKLALSVDGAIAGGAGTRTRLTGRAAQDDVHRLRAGFDAILVGAGTARTDDPLLTVRGPLQPRVPPARVVLDPTASLPPAGRLVGTIGDAPVWVVHTAAAPADRVRRLQAAGVRTLEVVSGPGGAALGEALGRLAHEGAATILCEGGGRLAGRLLAEDRAHRMILYCAPQWLGRDAVAAFDGARPARPWRIASVARLGADVRLVLDPGDAEET
jgi:diaminohydroxyphosphoribosylaminopyrimidine deaminase/5-amino-6-(5-phosphoribosylamino)uracil reductase